MAKIPEVQSAHTVTVSTLALLLTVGCALAFSGADIFRKLLAGGVRPVPLLFALAAGMTPPFLLWYLQQGAPAPQTSYWVPGLTSTLLNVGANLAFIEAVRVSPLSLTIPLLSLTPVFTTVLAIPLLGEVPDLRQGLGIGFVVIGALWLNLERGDLSIRQALRSFSKEPGSRLMVMVALVWALAMPLDKMALMRSSAAFHGTVLNVGVAIALLVMAGSRGTLSSFRDLRGHHGLLAGGIGLSVMALALQLLAIGEVWVGFVETMKRGLGSFLALLWGRLIFGEAFEFNRFVAVAFMALGVALIVL